MYILFFNLLFFIFGVSGFIAALCSEDKGKVILQLLQLLPLLQAGNEKAKAEYLKLIPEVLSHTIDHGVNIEESRQLLSYSLIHPAITQEERSKFRMWLGFLEERFTYNISHTRPTAPSTQPGHDGVTPPFPPVSASLSQEGLNNLLGTAAASPAVSSPNTWQGQATHFVPDGGAVSAGGLGEGGAGGAHVNGHQNLRASNSHAGAFSVHHQHNGHMPLHATTSAPPQFDSVQAASVVQGE